MTCRGICNNYRAKMPIGGSHYRLGHKRCNGLCNGIWMEWVGNDCPCCNFKLRTRPRSGKYKAKLDTFNKLSPTQKMDYKKQVRLMSLRYGGMNSRGQGMIRREIAELTKKLPVKQVPSE